MTISIAHGVNTSPYFTIIQPRNKFDEPIIDRTDKPIVELRDPKSKAIVNAELVDAWTMDAESFDKFNGMALLTYGMPAAELKNILLERYPQLKSEFTVQYWLLKRI